MPRPRSRSCSPEIELAESSASCAAVRAGGALRGGRVALAVRAAADHAHVVAELRRVGAAEVDQAFVDLEAAVEPDARRP